MYGMFFIHTFYTHMGSRNLKESLNNNVKSNQNVVNNVIISTDGFIDRQILLDNVSADNMRMVFFYLLNSKLS